MRNTIDVTVFFNRAGFPQTTLKTKYFVSNYTYTNTSLAKIFQTIREGSDVAPQGYGFSNDTLGLIGIFIDLLVMGFAAKYTMRGAGVVGVIVLAFLAYANIIPWAWVMLSGITVLGLLFLLGVM